MSTFLLIDSLNLFHRARHSVRGDVDMQVGMAMHIMFNAIKKAWNDFQADHVIVCLDGRSWRKDFYTPYKRNRSEARAALSPKEQEEDRVLYEAFNDFREFIEEKTNCTVLKHPRLEADDLIAGFIQGHPHDQHVIVSTDSDFYQLLAPNVTQFNGVTEETHSLQGIFDKKGKVVVDNKTKEPKKIPDPEWLLFEKCMRGDNSDNVFSAYPGVRTKGSKKRVGLLEAFEDRKDKGYNYNNLMLQKWVDHEGVEHRVLDDYQRNRTLIDLSAQPADIRAIIDSTIAELSVPKDVTQVGIRMLKFCNLYALNRIADNIQQYSTAFQAKYPTRTEQE